MFCWSNAGASKRRIRNLAAEAPPEPLGGCSDLSHIYESPGMLVRTFSSPIISRPQSAGRLHRIVSMNSIVSFFSSPTSAKVKGSGKRSEIPRGMEIEVVKEEPQLVEAMMSGGSRGLAKKTYSVLPGDYQLLEEIGKGSSATVYRGMYIPYNEIVAVKCLDLDRCNSNLDYIKREAQTMSMIDHPNVVKGYCSFVVEHSLWLVMPFMAVGSCLHLMKVAYPDGFEEHVIGSILKETLKALDYLHKHGHIHRDVKAGNILLDSSGVIKLSDFGVTAGMFDMGDRKRSRNTFVGTPCWMAPEVMQPEDGYDFKADIWSFGITALELAHGHAPFSKHPPMKVLLMTLQNAPPGLDYDRDKKFSKSFKEMVAMCLVKDQTKRPTAEKLLKHSFFKNAKPPELSLKSLLADLPPLWDRVKALQRKDAEQLALKKMPSSEQEAVSMIEYQRAVSAWNFDIEDLKIQASLIVDDENINESMEDDGSLRNLINNKEPKEKLLSADKNSDRAESENELRVEKTRCHTRSASSLSGPLMFPSRISANSLSVAALSLIDRDSPDDMCRSNAVQIKGRFSVTSENADVLMGSLRTRSASFNDFASIPTQMPSNELSKENRSMLLPDSILVPHLHNFAQETSFQQDHFTDLLNGMQQNDIVSTFLTGIPSQTFKPENDVLTKAETTERERILLLKIADLQARMISLTNELSAARLKHTQLQQQLSTASSKRNGEEA